MNIANLKIGTRLGAGFAIVLLLLVTVAALGISRMAQIKERLDEVAKVNDVEIMQLITMRTTLYDRMVAIRNIALLSDASEMQSEVARVKALEKKYADAEDMLNRMYADDAGTTVEEKVGLQSIKEAEKATLPLMAKAEQLALAHNSGEAGRILTDEARPIQKKWFDALAGSIDLGRKINEQAVTNAESAYENARTLMLLLSGMALALGAGIAWAIMRSITRPIGIAVAVAKTVASGDLTGHIEVKSKDEAGQLLQALKEMNESLVRIVGEVRGGTDTIASASSQIAGGNLDLSSRTEQQASSLEETASSMEELTSTVKQNTDNARQANVLAQSASEVASKGGEVVSEVVLTMGAINESAKKIVDIISVIDGIAFQTNILALNAAVEAARAGEQGRGFAVVASEVRNLAQRSAAAAKEIKALISDSVEKVDGGAKLVNQAGATMQEIVESVKRVTDIMAEITAATQEQTSGIEQINQAIAQMDEVTQQNASLVEEAAAASESLQDQARNLAQVVSVFKLGSDQTAAIASEPSARKIQSVRQAASHATGTVLRHKQAFVVGKHAAVNANRLKVAANAGAGRDSEWEEF